MLDFVPNHTGLDHPWVEDHPEYYVAGTEVGPGARAAELHAGQADAGRPAARPRPRPVLRRLAGHAAARLRQSGHAGGDDRRAAEDRRAMRRRALRHGHARPAGRLRADLGPPGAAVLAEGDRSACGSGSRASASWPRSTGTSNGRCCSRGSTTPTTSGSTTACARDTRGRCASTCYAGLDYQNKLARFLENHDEPRAAATFAPGMHEAAAVITFLSPGLRFFHQGQFEGRRKRISPHLVRAPLEPADDGAAAVLRRSAGGAPAADRSRRPVAPARVRAGLGRQLDVGLLHRLVLAALGRPAAARRRQLRRRTRASVTSACRFPSWAAARCGSRI